MNPHALLQQVLGLTGRGLRGVSSVMRGLGQRVESGVFHGAEAIGGVVGNPLQSARAFGSLAKRIGPSLGTSASALMGNLRNAGQQGFSGARGLYNRADQFLQSKGFTGLSPVAYFKNLGQALKPFATVVGGPLFHKTVMAFKALANITGISKIPTLFSKLAGTILPSVFGGGHGGQSSRRGPGSAAILSVKTLLGPTAMLAKLFLELAGPTGVILTLFGLRKFATLISESNRDLAKYNGRLAVSFAQLDIAHLRSDILTSQATSGSGTELNRQLADLIHEIQPTREALGTLVNVVGIEIVKASKTLIGIARTFAETVPFLRGAVQKLKDIEDELKRKNPGQAGLGTQIMERMMDMGNGQPNKLQRLAPPPFIGGAHPRPGWWDRRGRGRRHA